MKPFLAQHVPEPAPPFQEPELPESDLAGTPQVRTKWSWLKGPYPKKWLPVAIGLIVLMLILILFLTNRSFFKSAE